MSTTNGKQRHAPLDLKQRVRTIVRGSYDIQKLRIEAGNRLSANFREKLGIASGTSEEDAEGADVDILETLRVRYEKITEGIAEVTARRKYDFDGVISDFTELRMVDHWRNLYREEQRSFRDLGRALEGIPIFDRFLKGVKGVGPAMAGVIVSEIDITAAPYPSSLWKFAGLDVVDAWYLVERNGKEISPPKPVMRKSQHGNEIAGGPPKEAVETGEGERMVMDDEGNATAVYVRISRGRSRRKEHLEEYPYEDADGNQQWRRGLTFNPFLKTKLVGVLAPSFLRAGKDDNPYRDVYDDYRHRLDNHPRHEGKPKAHKHNMAMRYMIKQFLQDLHIKWAELHPDCTPTEPYHEAKLGMKHGEPKDAE